MHCSLFPSLPPSLPPFLPLSEQLSASELKKLQRKQKKAQLKAQAAKAAEEKTKEHKPHGKGANEEDKKLEEKGPKFDPMKLLQVNSLPLLVCPCLILPYLISPCPIYSSMSHFPMSYIFLHVSFSHTYSPIPNLPMPYSSTSQSPIPHSSIPLCFQTDNALEEAVKFLIPLQTLAPGHVATHTMAYEVHSRRRKVLQMLQALKRLHAIDPDNGELHRMVVDYVLTSQ